MLEVRTPLVTTYGNLPLNLLIIAVSESVGKPEPKTRLRNLLW